MSRAFHHFEETIAVGAERVIHAYARMLTIIMIDGDTKIGVGLGHDPVETFYQGLGYELPQGSEYATVRLRNLGTASVTVTGVLSMDRVYLNDRALVLDEILSELKGENSALAYIAQVTVSTTAVQIAAAATAPRKIVLQQKYPGGGGYVYIGKANNVSSSLWMAQLMPGGSCVIDKSDGQIWAVASSGTEYVGGYTL